MSILARLLGKKPKADDTDTAQAEWQMPVLKEICIAMLRQVPEDWRSAHLILEPTEKGLGAGMAHSPIMRTLRTDPASYGALQDGEFVMPDMAVMAATRKLELGWVERNGSFKRAIISALHDGETWGIKSDYEHQD